MNRSLAPIVAALALMVGVLAGTALAHADLVSSAPAAGSTVATAPAVVTLNFTEALAPTSTGKVTGPNGAIVSTGSKVSTTNAKQLAITLSTGLGNGLYKVSYHSVAMDDMATDDDAITFGVGVAVPSTSTEPTTNMPLALLLLGSAAVVGLVSTVALRKGRRAV